jgi:hypothetical protein
LRKTHKKIELTLVVCAGIGPCMEIMSNNPLYWVTIVDSKFKQDLVMWFGNVNMANPKKQTTFLNT